MVVRTYEIDGRGISSPIRIALIADLHCCRYGEKLIRVIDAQAPDLILMAGDIFDNRMAMANAEQLFAGISGRYPCYYVTGNHEYGSGAAYFRSAMSVLAKYGVTVLSNTCETREINGNEIHLCGVDDPYSYMLEFDWKQDPQGYEQARQNKHRLFCQRLDDLKSRTQDDHFTILLSHRPERFENYVSRGFDLVLCGHAHGGQWRIPGILNGLYAPHQGLFPRYAGGKYEKDGTTMIVSRGLATTTTPIPRFFNPPELVVIAVK